MKRFIVGLAVAAALIISPLITTAFALPMFGGYVTTVTACTCPPFGLMLTYSPLYLNSSIPTAGSLYYPVTAILYAYFSLVPTTWELGAFTPGGGCHQPDPAQVAAGDPDPCTPGIYVPTLGTINFVGTSRPGASPK